MRRKIARETVKLLAAFLILFPVLNATAADTVEVRVSFFQLSPTTVYITAGDSVSWVEDDDEGPYIVSGVWGNPEVPITVQFPAPGTYPYTASTTIFPGNSWGGTINVTPANSPPSVTITNPANNAIFNAPATFLFAADASDVDPGVFDVVFSVNDVEVDDVLDPPYVTTISNLAAGNYTLMAVAWDWSLASATNSITITVVDPGTIILTGSTLAAGKFKFNATGLTVGKTNVLQTSTNPASSLNWVPVSTNVAASSTMSFTNTITAGPHFFRIRQLP